MRIVDRPNGEIKKVACFQCGNDVVSKWHKKCKVWRSRGCLICYRKDRIDIYKRQFLLDLKKQKNVDGKWRVSKSENSKLRVAKTLTYAIKELGDSTARRVLREACLEYWEVTIGRWARSLQS